MIFLSDIQGTITAVVPDKIYQGSSNAKELILIAPFPSTSAVSVSILLPNGQRLVPQIANPNEFVMSFLSGFEGKLRTPEGRILHAWRLSLDAPVTQYSGNLSVQFLIANGNGVIEATSESVVNIGRGTPYLTPSNVSEWSQILNSIQQYYADMRELIEWDYVITSADIDSNNFIGSFQARLNEAKGYVLVKGVIYTDAWFYAGINSETLYIKFVGCQISCDIGGNVSATIDGFSGVSWNNRERASTLVTFGRVINCYQVALLNCLRVSNSTIQCYRYDVSDEPHTVDDVIFINPEGSLYNDPALACVNPINDIPNGAASKGNNCTVSNITFINGNAQYRTIMNATSVSEVRRVGNIPITYTGCGYVDGLSCMDYYTAEDDGKAILASADGSKKLTDIYSKKQINDLLMAIQSLVDKNSELINTILEGEDPDKVDSVKDLIAYVNAHGAQVTGMLEDIADLKEKEEWDFVITKLEDFTTAKLATMSGRVLVKGVNYDTEYSNSVPRLAVTIPASIKVIKFINSTIYAEVTAVSKSTAITGFIGGGVKGFLYSIITNFGAVEHCGGYLDVISCNNIMHTRTHICRNCYNLQDIAVYGDYSDGIDYGFWNCVLITGVTIEREHGQWNDEDYIVEFQSCKHISNVHLSENSSEGTVINYDENCRFVNGDTCDGYYTEEDNGKVQTVNTDGSKSLISVYDKTEIDDMLGDIETSLDSIIAIQNALIGGTT